MLIRRDEFKSEFVWAPLISMLWINPNSDAYAMHSQQLVMMQRAPVRMIILNNT